LPKGNSDGGTKMGGSPRKASKGGLKKAKKSSSNKKTPSRSTY